MAPLLSLGGLSTHPILPAISAGIDQLWRRKTTTTSSKEAVVPPPPHPETRPAPGLVTGPLVSGDSFVSRLCLAALRMEVDSIEALAKEATIPPRLIDDRDAGRTPLHCVAASYLMVDASPKAITFSLLKGVPTWQAHYFNPPLPAKESSVVSSEVLHALTSHLVAVATALLDHFPTQLDINHADRSGNTALHLAAIGGVASLVAKLIQHQADIHLRNDANRTALHLAAVHGHVETCALLVSAGSDLLAPDTFGVTPKMIMERAGSAILSTELEQAPALGLRKEDPKLIPYEPVAAESSSGGWSQRRMDEFPQDTDRCEVDMYYSHEINGSEVFRRYIATLTPVLLRGVLPGDWPGYEHYSKRRLMDDYGRLEVTASSIPYNEKFGGDGTVTLTLGEYIEALETNQTVGDARYPYCTYTLSSSPPVMWIAWQMCFVAIDCRKRRRLRSRW